MAQNILTVGRDAQMAVLLSAKWYKEIEEAVDKVKLGIIPASGRTEEQKWWRKQYYRAQAIRRKHERRVAMERATRHMIGCGGKENGTNAMAACR